MQFYYGEKNILRALDEAEFWKNQEAEHTVVIRLVTPGLEKDYVQTLKEFEQSFHEAYAGIIGYVQSVIRSKGDFDAELKCEMLKCIKYCIEQSKKFVDFLEYLQGNSEAVKNNDPSQTVIYHIIRESKYFIGIERLVLAEG